MRPLEYQRKPIKVSKKKAYQKTWASSLTLLMQSTTHLSGSNGNRPHNHLVRLRTKWMFLLLSLKLQIWRLLRTRSSLTFRQTRECRFTLKLARDMTITCSYNVFMHHHLITLLFLLKLLYVAMFTEVMIKQVMKTKDCN